MSGHGFHVHGPHTITKSSTSPSTAATVSPRASPCCLPCCRQSVGVYGATGLGLLAGMAGCLHL